MIMDGVIEFEDLNNEAEEIREPKETAEVIKQYEDIIKMKKKKNYKRRLLSSKGF